MSASLATAGGVAGAGACCRPVEVQAVAMANVRNVRIGLRGEIIEMGFETAAMYAPLRHFVSRGHMKNLTPSPII